MTDPFDALRITDAPLDPRPEFASELRRILATALETTMTDTATTSTTTPTTTPTTTQQNTQTITAYISVRNAAAALDFYVGAFAAVERSRLVSDDGRIGHAEIMIGTSKLMLADEYPEIDSVGPETRGGPTCSFSIEVPDVDASFARAVAAGAIIERPVADQFHGNRMGWVRDPFGHRWTLSTPIAGFDRGEFAKASREEGYELIESQQLKRHSQGDLYYFTLPVHDLTRAQAFFGAVLGWQFADPQQGHVANISAPPGGIAQVQGGASTRAQLWFVVDDIHAAVARVRELGGSADDPVLYDSGWSADCVDDQGTTFNLSVPATKYSL
ncbi:MAG: VOC family protein [Ilumatobacteraceae bacterium]